MNIDGFKYDESWDAEERQMFDELVREQMEKIEREVKSEAQINDYQYGDAASPSRSVPQYGKPESYSKLSGGSSAVIARQDEWAEAQRRLQDGRRSIEIPLVHGLPSSDSNSHMSKIGHRSHQADSSSNRQLKQQEYAQQLREDQDRRSQASLGAPAKYDSGSQPTQMNMMDQIGQRSASQYTTKPSAALFGDQAELLARRDKQQAYARQLDDQKAGRPNSQQQFGRGSSEPFVEHISNPSSYNTSPRGEYTGAKLGNSGRNIFSGPDPSLVEAEAKRIKQKKYYDDLTSAAHAAPITSERATLRKPHTPSGGGVGLNLGGMQLEDSSRALKKEQQRLYSDQLAQAATQSSIPSEYVRKDKKKADVGGGSEIVSSYTGPGGARAADHSGYNPYYGNSSPRPRDEVPRLPTERVDADEAAARKRMQQREYSRLLQEDSQRGPILSPRTTLHRRPLSPDESRNVSPRSPGGFLASGLSTSGLRTSASQRRAQQSQYSQALERDLEQKRLLAESAANPSARRTGVSHFREMSPIAPPANLPFAPDSASTEAVHREKQRQYAMALARDRQTGPIEASRAPVVRRNSPTIGSSRVQQEPSPAPVYANQSHGYHSGMSVQAPAHQSAPSYSSNPSHYEDEEGEEMYRQYVQRMKRDAALAESDRHQTQAGYAPQAAQYPSHGQGPRSDYGAPQQSHYGNGPRAGYAQPTYQEPQVRQQQYGPPPGRGGAVNFQPQPAPVSAPAPRYDSRQRGQSSGGGNSSITF